MSSPSQREKWNKVERVRSFREIYLSFDHPFLVQKHISRNYWDVQILRMH